MAGSAFIQYSQDEIQELITDDVVKRFPNINRDEIKFDTEVRTDADRQWRLGGHAIVTARLKG